MNKGTRKIGLWTAVAVVIANMVGTGIFTSLGFQIVDVKSVFALLMLWVVGGAVALSGAMSYGELGSAMPRSGGEYHFLSRIYHPVIGFLAGWSSLLVGFAAPVALAAIAMSTYLGLVFPDLNVTFVACIIVVIISVVHSFNIHTGGVFQVIVTSVKVLLVFFFIFAGLTVSAPETINLKPSHSDWSQVFSGAFAVSLIFVSYAFSGWNASVYISGEIKNPERSIPASLLIGTLIVGALYLLLNFVFLYTSPLAEIEGKIEVGFVSANYIFGISGGRLMAVIIAILLISTISAMIWIGPRVSQIMGEDYRILRIFSKRNKNGVPVFAIWFQSMVTIILIISATFDQVLVYAGFVLNVFTLLCVTGVIVLRIREPGLVRPYKVWGYPITPLIFISLSVWTLTYIVIERPFESLIGIVTVFSGLVFYLIDKKINKSENLIES